jgi:hypothetical protein
MEKRYVKIWIQGDKKNHDPPKARKLTIEPGERGGMNRPFPLSGLLSRPEGRREILEGCLMSKKKPKKKNPTKKKTRKVPSSPPADKAVPSLQSMEGFLEGFAGIGRSKRSAVHEAQQVMYDAWEAPTRQRAVALARKALTISADCADAYNLLDFRKHGDSQTASRSLKAALDENKHVPAYILVRKKIPRTLPSYYGFGDDNEAVLYAYGNMAAWKATPGSL